MRTVTLTMTEKQLREAAYEIFDRLHHPDYHRFHTSEDISRMIEAHCSATEVKEK